MPGKLRIFLSSTMEDLENERLTVVKRLNDSNFEPVNAEGLLPDGAASWERILEEIESCHVFLLLSGVRYGWVPKDGPLAHDDISVTHGEYREARKVNLPVLPFFKVLKYGSDADSDDARRRDEFRKDVGEWDKGQFRTEFNNVLDLPDKVVAAITRMLTDAFQSKFIAQRRADARVIDSQISSPLQKATLPRDLAPAVARGAGILWAGSGISLAAGIPTSTVLATDLARCIRDRCGSYSVPSVGSGLASVAADFEMVFGRKDLISRLGKLLSIPGDLKPTPEHFAAVSLFPRIITTNYDVLFEGAAEERRSGHTVITGPDLPSPTPERFIWKIHGALDHSEVLVVNETDIGRFESSANGILSSLRSVFERSVLLVGGTSLRDPSILRLFTALRGEVNGYWTVLPTDTMAAGRAAGFGLQPVKATLESVLATLQLATAPSSNP